MTKLEIVIRHVSDLRDFYLKIKKEKSKNHKTGTTLIRPPVVSAPVDPLRRKKKNPKKAGF